jgi:hypothetical protein
MNVHTASRFIVVACVINGCEGANVASSNGENVVSLSSAQLSLECRSLADCQPYDVCIINGTVQCLNNACVGRMQTDGDVKISCIVDIYKSLHEGSMTNTPSSTTTGGTASTPLAQCKCDCTSDRANGIACTVCATLSQCPNQDGTGGAPPVTVVTGGSVSTTPSLCGKVNPPPEDVAQTVERAVCSRADGPGNVSSLAEVRAWVDVTADTPGSTLKVLSLSVFGVQSNGTSVIIGGTALGNPTVTWSGLWLRTPWFPDPSKGGDKKGEATLLSNGAYVVPTNPYVLHLGNAGGPAGTYVDFFVAGTFQTTGDTKVSVGIDGYAASDAQNPAREIGISNWYSCTTGTIEAVSYNSTLSDPCSNQKGTVVGAPSSTINPSTSCPSTGIQITAASSLLSACPSGLQVVTWDNQSNLIRSSAGSPLAYTFNSNGFAHVTTMCNGTYRTSWPAAGTIASNAGFARVCSAGQDLTNSAILCNDGTMPKLFVALNPSETGRCQ